MTLHTHKFKFDSELSGGHDHRLSGMVDNMVGLGGFHLHYYTGVSSYRSHTHYFYGFTGLPVKTGNGHIHKMEGSFEVNSQHDHKYNGFTFEEVSYISGQHPACTSAYQ